LEACRLAAEAPTRILVASSDKAYGNTPPPYHETDPLQPIHPYDVSKAAADWIAGCYAHNFGLPIVITRCGNIYGPGDLHPDRLVPTVCRAIHAGRAIQLRSTGQMTREWLFLTDAVDALLQLVDRAERLSGQAFNVGGGDRATVRHVVDTLLALAKVDLHVEAAEQEAEGEIPDQFLNCEPLRKLGWKANVSLEEGLERTLGWYALAKG
jgi:CDP-glucose 4,6-dehydratase